MAWCWTGDKQLCEPMRTWFNTLRPRQNGRHFADDMFKCIFLNENVWIPIEISLTFVPKGSINNNPALFQIMAWRRPGDKPLSEPMINSSLTHICVTRPQWVNDAYVDIMLRIERVPLLDDRYVSLGPNELMPRTLYVRFSVTASVPKQQPCKHNCYT